MKHFLNEFFVPCPARGEALTDKIRLVTNQFDVEHGAI
jgi:hypothetical protein